MIVRFTLLALAAFASSQTVPGNFVQLECSIQNLAAKFAARDPQRIPSRSPNDVTDALTFLGCNVTGEGHTTSMVPARETLRSVEISLKATSGTAYVATNGSDVTGTGSLAKPWATLQHAVRMVRSSSINKISLRAGKYFFNETIVLSKADSGLTITNYPHEKVILSGARNLKLNWEASPQKGVYQASVSLPKRGPNLGPEIVNQLFVDGERMVRARFPNANPAVTSGLCFSKGQRDGEGCFGWLQNNDAGKGYSDAGTTISTFSVGPARGDSPTLGCEGCSDFYPNFATTIFDPPADHPIYNKPLRDYGYNNNSMHYLYSSPFWRPINMGIVDGSFQGRKWAKPDTGVVHVKHTSLWGTWQYRIKKRVNQDVGKDEIFEFAYGGHQNRVSGAFNGNRYYVENIREELDVPGEWFYDEDTEILYVFPNSTVSEQTEVTVPILTELFNVVDTANVIISGVTITETRAIFMEQYELPSGGDWAVQRTGSIYVRDSTNVEISGCEFLEVGGNAIAFSNNVTHSKISSNEMWRTGESAVVFVGRTETIFGNKETYPNHNEVSYNHMHEIGVYGKQTSCFFQALSANSTIKSNICYNGPRAGINFNDGFGGGHHLVDNLVFNMVRETSDHGPFNSWDRQAFLTKAPVDDGFPDSVKWGLSGLSILPEVNQMTNNFIINGYNGVWSLDHDDGSSFYNDSDNLLVWGGCKNYEGHSKNCTHNVIVYPGIPNRSSGTRRCQTSDNSIFGNQFYFGNQCITNDGNAYSINSYSGPPCTPKNLLNDFYHTHTNKFYSPGYSFTAQCSSTTYDWTQWIATSQDADSLLFEVPDIPDIVKMGAAKLRFSN
eukprot:TRINITY_DN6248_c0_g1_i1.p1 TRINITY_DN6248_c0_g1~~TRINITY_DN6248_c0_g1_i1.p1  ORF type:complete len:851 (+),score=175.79 TRINITY_DN6248_c0_g1_i1:40-2553(+)